MGSSESMTLKDKPTDCLPIHETSLEVLLQPIRRPTTAYQETNLLRDQ